ncbi:hypothetical protein [Roseibium sp.]|uniref:hypothetical protein n=1 Tax=Roseibium sp. TaxID=1936156 RepID=UPI003A9780F0
MFLKDVAQLVEREFERYMRENPDVSVHQDELHSSILPHIHLALENKLGQLQEDTGTEAQGETTSPVGEPGPEDENLGGDNTFHADMAARLLDNLIRSKQVMDR